SRPMVSPVPVGTAAYAAPAPSITHRPVAAAMGPGLPPVGGLAGQRDLCSHAGAELGQAGLAGCLHRPEGGLRGLEAPGLTPGQARSRTCRPGRHHRTGAGAEPAPLAGLIVSPLVHHGAVRPTPLCQPLTHTRGGIAEVILRWMWRCRALSNIRTNGALS